jgi:hypothetical protein
MWTFPPDSSRWASTLRPKDRMMSPTRALRRFLRSQHQIRRVTNQPRLVNTLPALVQWR